MVFVCYRAVIILKLNLLFDMKKNMLLLIAFCCCYQTMTWAQAPTITANQNPLVGSYADLYTAPVGSVATPGAGGANLTWDFSNFSLNTPNKLEFQNASETPYAATFPNTIAAYYRDGLQLPSAKLGYEFFSTAGNMLTKKGIANVLNVVVNYTDPKKVLTYPFTFGSNFTDDFSATYTVQGATVSEQGTVSVSADGYGTLILPFGTVQNVLRVHTTETYTQTIPGFPNPLNYVTHTYNWYRPDWAFPVISITTETVDVSPQTVTTAFFVNYIPTNVGTPTIDNSNNSLSVYPNPATTTTNVQFDLPTLAHAQLAIYNAVGQLVSSDFDATTVGKQNIVVDCSQYPRGVYTIVLTTAEGQTQTQRLIVQ